MSKVKKSENSDKNLESKSQDEETLEESETKEESGEKSTEKLYRRERKKENGVTLGMFLMSFSIIALVLLLTIPNIFLDNNIYYESREIAHYKSVQQTLQEEQRILINKLEEIKYKNVLDDN